MKTTAGKTKAAAPRGKRAVHVYEVSHRGLLAVRQATSLKQALVDYYDETLKPAGWAAPKHVGNTIQVKRKKVVKLFRALEPHQAP